MDKFKIIHIVSYALLISLGILHYVAAGIFGDYKNTLIVQLGLSGLWQGMITPWTAYYAVFGTIVILTSVLGLLQVFAVFKNYSYNKRVFSYCLLGCDIFALLCNFAIGTLSCVQSVVVNNTFLVSNSKQTLIAPYSNLLNVLLAEAILGIIVGIVCGAYNIYSDTRNILETQKNSAPQPIHHDASNANVTT